MYKLIYKVNGGYFLKEPEYRVGEEVKPALKFVIKQIGHFRHSLSLSFKTRLSAKFLL